MYLCDHNIEGITKSAIRIEFHHFRKSFFTKNASLNLFLSQSKTFCHCKSTPTKTPFRSLRHHDDSPKFLKIAKTFSSLSLQTQFFW